MRPSSDEIRSAIGIELSGRTNDSGTCCGVILMVMVDWYWAGTSHVARPQVTAALTTAGTAIHHLRCQIVRNTPREGTAFSNVMGRSPEDWTRERSAYVTATALFPLDDPDVGFGARRTVED